MRENYPDHSRMNEKNIFSIQDYSRRKKKYFSVIREHSRMFSNYFGIIRPIKKFLRSINQSIKILISFIENFSLNKGAKLGVFDVYDKQGGINLTKKILDISLMYYD